MEIMNELDHFKINNNIHIISYASRTFIRRKTVIQNKLNNYVKSGIIKSGKVYTESDIDNKFKSQISDIWKLPKGGGYWSWKSWIINDYLDKIQDGDILIYMDVGCDINLDTPSSINQLNEYIKLITDTNKCGLLRYNLEHLEGNYTNKKLIDYMFNRYYGNNECNNKCNNEFINEYINKNNSITRENIIATTQLVGGIMYMRKCQWVINFFKEALDIIIDDPYLITDKYNNCGEIHRHDQSLLSLLYKIMGGDIIIKDITYPKILSNEEKTRVPILAYRKKK